jgi:hypothetical protein
MAVSRSIAHGLELQIRVFIGLAILLVAFMRQEGLVLLGVIFGAYGQEMNLKVFV